VRPERQAGFATVTVRVPLGDLLADELERIGTLATDGVLTLTRDQNVLVRSVPVAEISSVLGGLAEIGLGPYGARGAVDVRACPGLAFCSLAITASHPLALDIERRLGGRPDLPSDASIAVSGCPNSCTRHQTADVGLAGGKVKVGGRVGLGYQLFLGADVARGKLGEPTLRVLDTEAPAAVIAVLELWVALRRPGERPGQTFHRVGMTVVASALALRLRGDENALGADHLSTLEDPATRLEPAPA